MKILLAGFSAQNAAALSLLIIQKYNEHSVVELDLSFGDSLRLCLPTIPTHHQDAQAVIVNLGGVGMPNILPEQWIELQSFIGSRAALLTAPLQKDTFLEQLDNSLVSCLLSPYSKADMEQALQGLLAAAAKVATMPVVSIKKSVLDSRLGIDNGSYTTGNAPTHFLYDVLDTHFDIPQIALLRQFVEILLTKTPLKVVVGAQTMYIESSLNMALVTNWQRLMDACAVLGEFNQSTQVMKITPMTKREFEGVNDSSVQKHPINTLLWQMADRLLPKKIVTSHHSLLLKMRFMPNLGNDGRTPEYVRALVSSCLLVPKTPDMLMLRMGELADEGLINRVFLLAILSGMADSQVLEQSFIKAEKLPQNTTNVAPSSTHNQGVQKAQKTGFLARFLTKLGF